MKNHSTFYGSDEDLAQLRQEIEKEDFTEYQGNFIRASGIPITPSFAVVIVVGIGSCIKKYLETRGKRMVTRETHGERIVIKGNFSADEIERLIQIPHSLDIVDEKMPLLSADVQETIWTKSNWMYDELENQTVEFKIPARGGIVHGLGKFLVRKNPDGLLAIDATTDTQGRDPTERVFTRYHLPQIAVDRIERHPNQSVAMFQLV
ncbi:MAG: hypothetical protein WAO02_04650 [Verrucomicrobiia bacterium]